MEGDTSDEKLEDDAMRFDIEGEGEDDIDDECEDDIEGEDDIQDKENSEIIEPERGMVFPSYDALYDFWRAYGTTKGFPARKRSSAQRHGQPHYITLMCSLGGKSKTGKKSPSKSQPHTRLGCPVKLVGSLATDGQWRITKLVLEHNHLLSPTIHIPIRRRLELNDRTGIRVNKNINACIDEVGGHESATFTQKDARNHVDKTRHLRLGEGDAMAIQDYFLNMQTSNPGFIFSMDIDSIEGRLQNIFWADTRSIEAYKEFGRVVTFDTTYLVNRYDIPFAPFVGVNHHGHSVLLGCGLISSEDTETFCWLFRTWLKCMSGVAPEGIITDQDKAMQNAIKIVFPNTRHRWCLWHITSKFPNKFVGYKKRLEIIYHLQSAIYDSHNPLEFEQSWSSMLEKYDLHENDWLSGLYDERQRWIPCFVKSSYWAGMSTTQRCESINGFFDGYVNAKTTIKKFVELYGNALRSKVEKETEADYKSNTQLIDLVTHWAMEKQFQSVYTLSKFKEFQNEVKGKQYCSMVSKKVSDWGSEWMIVEDMIIGDGIPKRVNFTILMSESQDGCDLKCSCHLFEFKGILCRHAMHVFLTTYGNVNLPAKYVFNTWRKDVKRCHSRMRITYDGWVGTTEQKRYEELCTLFSKVAIMGSEDEDKRKEVVDFLEFLKDHLSSLKPASVQPSSSSGESNSMNDIKGEGQGEDDIEGRDDIEDKKNNEIIEPECGMVFPSYDAVYDFWRAYGTTKGFPVRKSSSAQRHGQPHYFTLMCSFGAKSISGKKSPSKSQPHTQLGCPVKLVGSSGTDGQWRITKLVIEHNHLLSPTKVILHPVVKRGKWRPPENRRISLREKIARKIKKAALKNSETSLLKDSTSQKKKTSGKKRKIVAEANQIKLPSVSLVPEPTRTQKSTPLSTQECMSESSNTHIYTQESIPLGGHPTNEMSYIPQVYMGEREFLHGMNINLSLGVTPQISENPFWYNIPNAPTGYDPSAYIRPLGYAPNVLQRQPVQQQVQRQPMQQHVLQPSSTYTNNNM